LHAQWNCRFSARNWRSACAAACRPLTSESQPPPVARSAKPASSASASARGSRERTGPQHHRRPRACPRPRRRASCRTRSQACRRSRRHRAWGPSQRRTPRRVEGRARGPCGPRTPAAAYAGSIAPRRGDRGLRRDCPSPRKCTGGESNPYALRRRNLNPLRLPVSPPVRCVRGEFVGQSMAPRLAQGRGRRKNGPPAVRSLLN
jgi:hypothetical protein